jgi:hypothetical protein
VERSNVILSWATRILSSLLREEDVNALLGDLCEEYDHRAKATGPSVAGIYCLREVYRSITSAIRLRIVEVLRCAPWGVAIGSYLLVGVAQIGLTLMLSPIWPEVAQTTSAWGIVIVTPVVACIAYLAAKLNRRAPLLLGAMMFAVAALLMVATTETISTGYALSFLVLGPLSAVLGGSLPRPRQRP